MLTPDQIRIRMEIARSAFNNHSEREAVWQLLALLDAVLPDLVAAAQQSAEIGQFSLPNQGPSVRERESSRYRGTCT